MVKNYLIRGNVKMGENVYIFNIPPKKTCTPTDWCLKGKNGKPACYAQRNNFRLPSVIKALNERYELSLKEDFPDIVIMEAKNVQAEYIRIHSAGDFYSEEYVKKWIKIANNLPYTKLRATTRRRDLTSIIKELDSLPNVIIRESLDKDRTTPKMGLKFAALSYLPIAKGSYKCLNNCEICKHHCWNNKVDVCFDEH